MNYSFAEKRRIGSTAFTLVELLVVIVIVAMIQAAILLPVLRRAHQRATSIAAINNVRQLAVAWKMYSTDNAGYLPPNRDGEKYPSWVAGEMRGNENAVAPSINTAPYVGVEDYTNRALLLDSKFSVMGPFVQNPKIFLDPGDYSTWKDPGSATRHRRVRSFSMNCALGADIKDDGDFLGGAGPGATTSIWRYYHKDSDLVAPGPSDLWVFMDEHPDTINDGLFDFPMPITPLMTSWVNVPAAYHDGASAFAFADGHAELHAWQLLDVFPSVNWEVEQTPLVIVGQSHIIGDNPDVLWLAAHTTVASPNAP